MEDINQIHTKEEHHMGTTDFKRDFNGRLNSSSKTDS